MIALINCTNLLILCYLIGSSLSEPYRAIFSANHELSCGSHDGIIFHWNVEEEGLQIQNFPLHIVSRHSSGAFQMENENVIFKQVYRNEYDEESQRPEMQLL